MIKAILISLIIVFIFKTQTVFSKNILYDVNNISVTGEIKTNLDREKLIETALQKAFLKFINKILLNEDIRKISNTDTKIIKNLVFSYQIFNNQIDQNKQNILTINIKFDQKKFNKFLASKGISYADVSDISLKVLPIFVKDKEVFLYSDNFFYKNWKKNGEKNNELVKYNLALEDIEKLDYINRNKENLEVVNGKILFSDYANENTALILIYFSENKLRSYIKTFIQKKEINKNIELNFTLNDPEGSYIQAIEKIKNEITQIWKSQNLIDINTPSFLDFTLEIRNTNDYLKITNILNNIDIVDNFRVIELSKEHAKLRVKYNGKIMQIKNKLNVQNIEVSIEDNEWKLRFN